MRKKTKVLSGLLLTLLVCVLMVSLIPERTEAASERISFTYSTYKKNVNSDEFEIRYSSYGVGKITWTSSNKKVATVDKNGKVTINGSGTTKIKAVAKGKSTKKKITAVATVVVAKPSFTCTKSNLVLKKGSRTTYSTMLSVSNLDSNYVIDWTSEDDSIVTANSLGGRRVEIVANNYGSAVITGTIKGVGSVAIEVEVLSPVITCGTTMVEVEKTKTKTISTTIKNIPANDLIEWTCSNENIISIMPSGTSNRTIKITATDYGEATITGKIGEDENEATIEFDVYVLDPTITTSKATYEVRVNRKITISATTKYMPSIDYVTWTIENPEMASLFASGTSDKKITVTGLQEGTTTITGTTPQGAKVTVTLIVKP